MSLSFHSRVLILLTVLAVAWTYETGNVTYAEHIFGAHIATRDDSKMFEPHKPFHLHIVVVGDLHGDLDHTEQVLEFATVMDKQGHWTGHVNILVQLGDVMDRGPRPKAIIRLLKSLRDQAAQQNGHVFLLFGNHEFDNLIHIWKDVSKQEQAKYKSSAYRQKDLSTKGEIGKIWANDYFTALRLPLHPSMGGPNSLYNGKTHSIFSHSAIAFVHGGLSPDYPDLLPFPESINKISQSLLKKLQEAMIPRYEDNKLQKYKFPKLDKKEYTLLREDDSPLWYRGWAKLPRDDPTLPEQDTTLPEEDICKKLDEVLKNTGTSRMIMGHTIVPKITSKCNRKIILIDTGISRWADPPRQSLMSALDILYEIALEKDEHGVEKWVEKETYTAVYEGNRKHIIAESKRDISHP